MAAGNYQVDLTVINLAETNTDWNDINQAGGGGANTAEVDFAIQGNNAITRQVSNTRRGVLYDFGTPITLGADDHIYTWTVCSTPGIVENKSIGGIRVSIGTSTTAYYDYYVNGGDTLPEGGMNNYVVYYAAASASLTNGSPGANPQFFGAQADTNATARNVNFACDAIRYGTGYYIIDGDSTNPITFASASQDNDLNANRYGVFTAIPGGFAQKGRFVIGQTTAGVATQAYFNTSNTSVVFADTEFAQSDFTQIIVDHPSTFFNLRNTSLTGLGTKNPGQLNFLDSSTVGYLDNCTFNNIGTTQLQAAVTASSTWIGCSTVNQSGSIINVSTFNNTSAPVSALVSDRPDRVTNSTFISTGTKHGIEVTAAGNYIFTGNTLTGFDSGSNANEFLYFNPTGGTGDLTLTVVSGNGTIEFRNASTGTVTIVNSVTVTLTGLKDNTEVRIFESTNSYPQTELAGIEDATDGTTNDRSFSFSLEIGTVVDIVIHNKDYKYLRIEDFELTETQDLPVTQIFDRNYDNVGGEAVFLSDPYFTSLAARAVSYENETEAKTFVQYLETVELWESASHIYPAVGISDNTIHSLVPSGSSGDLITSSFTSTTNHSPRQYLRINSQGQYYTGSSDKLPLIGYGIPSQTRSGSFMLYSSNTINSIFTFQPNRAFDWVTDNGTTGNQFLNGIISTATTATTSSNTIFNYPDTSITRKVISGDMTSISDDNSGGAKEVFIRLSSNGQVFAGVTSLLCKIPATSGAKFVYISGSAQTGQSWYNLSTFNTGSSAFTGSTVDARIIDQGDGWYQAVLAALSDSTGPQNITFGLSDSDGGKTVTADGTNKLYINLLNATQQAAGQSLGALVETLSANNTSTSIVPPVTLNYFNRTANPITSVASAGVFYAEVGWHAFWDQPLLWTNSFSNSPTIGLAPFTVLASAPGAAEDGIRIKLALTGTTPNFSRGISVNMSGLGQTPTIPFNNFIINNATTNDILRKGGFLKVAIRREASNHAIYVNGTLEATQLTANVGTVPLESFYNAYNSRFRNICYFPHALTNTEMENLTSS